MTLRTRLAVAFGIVLLVLLALGVVLRQTVRSAQMEQVDRQLRRTLPIVERILTQGANLALPPREGGGPPTEESPNEVYVARQNTDGTRTELFSTLSGSDRSPAVPATSSGVSEEANPQTVGSETGSGSWRAVLVVASDGTEILVAVPLDAIGRTAQRIDTTIAVAGSVALLVVLAAGWWVLRLGLRPIGEVTKVAAAYAGGERRRRVPASGRRTEAAQLARTFNLMLDEQQAAEDRLRRFVADASHELRTPVAAIGGFADLYRHDAVAPDQLDDVMRRIGQESSRMRALVEDMLLLAQLDEHRPLSRGPVDLARLAHDAALDASGTHPSRAVTVEGLESLIVVGDEARLRQALANLVTNALVHTTGAVRIVVGFVAEGVSSDRGDPGTVAVRRVAVTVADEGPGLDPPAAELAFERFWRADPARSGTGSGLGLPIVHGIVGAHGGTLEFSTDPASGTRVTITLPA